jgi:hypothetical protein
VLLELASGLSPCRLRLNPPQIAVSIPNRGQRDRKPRRVSQPFIHDGIRCLVDARQPWLVPEATTLACRKQSRAATCLLATLALSIPVSAWQARKKKIHAHAGGHLSHTSSHPNPPPTTLQSPDSSIPLRAWLTAAHSTLTPLSVSILFPPPPRDARDSRCAGRTRAADADGGTPDHNVITALSRILTEGTDSSWRCGIDRWGVYLLKCDDVLENWVNLFEAPTWRHSCFVLLRHLMCIPMPTCSVLSSMMTAR